MATVISSKRSRGSGAGDVAFASGGFDLEGRPGEAVVVSFPRSHMSTPGIAELLHQRRHFGHEGLAQAGIGIVDGGIHTPSRVYP